MRLNICPCRIEIFFSVRLQLFHFVNHFNTAINNVSRISLGVFVGLSNSHGFMTCSLTKFSEAISSIPLIAADALSQ
jgi:hypothetical protein